jgi:hypothetical protein
MEPSVLLYDQQWVLMGSSAEAALIEQGYSVFMTDYRGSTHLWALLCKRKANTRLNTASEYDALREAQRKANAKAQMRHDIAERIAKGEIKTRVQRHRERLNRQGDRP